MDGYSAEEDFAREQDQKENTCFHDFAVVESAKDEARAPPRQALKFSVQRFLRLRLRFLRGLLRFSGFVASSNRHSI